MNNLKRHLLFVFTLFAMMMLLPAIPTQAKGQVRLNKKNVYIKEGKVKRLKMKGTKRAVLWRSANPQIVAVRGGYIKGLKPGTTYVYAKAGKYLRKCKVKVVGLSRTSAALSLGASGKLFVVNGKNTTWSSANSKIVSVSKKGVIKAKKTGYTWIKCKSRGYSFRCLVMVPELSVNEFKLRKGDSYQLSTKYTNLPRQWYSSNNSIATVDANGVVTGTGPGTVIIQCRTGHAVLNCQVIVLDKATTPKSSLPSSTTGSKAVAQINQFYGTRTYTIFSQTGSNKSSVYPRYMPNHGCAAATAVNVLSGMTGKVYTPATMVETIEKIVFGDAVYNNNYSKSDANQRPASLYGLTKILAYFGVKSTYVRQFSDVAAVNEIKDHLYTGNPVIIEVSSKNRYTNKTDKKWSNSKHTMAILGMTPDGYAIVADPANRSGFGSNQRIKFETLEGLIPYMFSCTNTSSTSCYYESASKNGGYILVNH